MASTHKQADTQRDLFVPALITFGCIYVAQTLLVGWFLIDWRYLSSFLYFFGFELIFIGIAYDLTESLFVIFVSPSHIPEIQKLNAYPSVALLMTVCDDVMPSRWKTLPQNYPNYDIYILDDSKQLSQRMLVDQSGFQVIRRSENQGFKAGNLNHWLMRYGIKYKYLVILDSDSIIPNDFLGRMVSYAEHPANQKIAIFQSCILPFEASTIFAKTLGSLASMRFYIFSRFANRTGLVLSWGHNQLLRTDAVLKVGGFSEKLTPEDTILSLMLSQIGYTVRLVNVVSYDTDPPNIFLFTRRLARWAGQTAEIFLLPWHGTDIRLKLLLCYHLYNYTVHNFYLALLFVTAWSFDSRGISPSELFMFIGKNIDHLWSWTLVLAEMTIIWCIQLMLGILISKRAGISLQVFFKHMLLATSLNSFAGLATNVSIFRALSGHKPEFTPTNSTIKNPNKLFIDLIRGLMFWLFTGLIIITGMCLRNRLLFFSLNGLWIIFWVLAPATLYFFHRDQLQRSIA